MSLEVGTRVRKVGRIPKDVAEGTEGTVRRVGDLVRIAPGNEEAAAKFVAEFPYEVEWDGHDYGFFLYQSSEGHQMWDRMGADEVEAIDAEV